MDVIVVHKFGGNETIKVEQRHIDQLKKHADNVYWFESVAELVASGVDAEVVCSTGPFQVEEMAEWCVKSKRLKWFNTLLAGVDAVMSSKIGTLPIIITNSKGVHGPQIAFHTIGLIAAHYRQFPTLFANQKAHKWIRPAEVYDTEGKTLGVIGAGAIGTDVAKFARGCGFRTIGVRRSGQILEGFDEMYKNEDIDKALAMMDVIVLLTPLTAQTKHLMNADRFKAVKKGAFLVNVARGGVLDHNALIDALNDGTLSGCGLDANDPEPLPPESTLWDMPNVIITPHCSGTSTNYMNRATNLLCENLDNFRHGRPMFNVIDTADLSTSKG